MADNNSYWAQMLNTPFGEQAREYGANALASGQVSPEEVQMGISPILKALGIKKKNPLLSAKKVAGPNALPEISAAPVAKGSGMTNAATAKAETTANTQNTTKDVAQQLQFMSPEQLDELYTATSSLPAFQDQAKGIETQKDLLKIAASAPTDIFSGPLAGLLETEFGRKVNTAAGMRGETPVQQRNNILAMGGKIQDDQRDLTKGIFEAIGKQRAGYNMTTIADLAGLKTLTGQTETVKAEDPNKFVKAGRAGPNINMLVEKHQKRMAPLEELSVAVQDFDEAIGGADNWKGGDIAGIGATRFMPEILLSNKGSENQQKAQVIVNILGKMRSGGAITSNELQRLSKETGASILASDRAAVSFIKRARAAIKAQAIQNEAAVKGTPVGPSVLNAYVAGGGKRSENYFPTVAPKAPAKKMSYDEWVKAGKPKAGQ